MKAPLFCIYRSQCRDVTITGEALAMHVGGRREHSGLDVLFGARPLSRDKGNGERRRYCQAGAGVRVRVVYRWISLSALEDSAAREGVRRGVKGWTVSLWS